MSIYCRLANDGHQMLRITEATMKRFWLAFLSAIMLSMAGIGLAGAQEGEFVHYVNHGETLDDIAAEYGVSVEAILVENNLLHPSMIYSGQALIIPGDYYYSEYHWDYDEEPYHAHRCLDYHIIELGEALAGIAFDYDVPLDYLMEYNDIYTVDQIYVGQRICIPGTVGYLPQRNDYYESPPVSYEPPVIPVPHPPIKPAPVVKPFYHKVASGETLHSIADRYGVSYTAIMKANNISDENLIVIGQQLLIPGYQPPPAKETVVSPKPEKVTVIKEVEVVKEDVDLVFDKDASVEVDIVRFEPAKKSTPGKSSKAKTEKSVEVQLIGEPQWKGKVWSEPDREGITTLIVKTGGKYGLTVQIRAKDYALDGESDRLYLGEFGPNRFALRYFPPGQYFIRIKDPEISSEIVPVNVAPGQRVEVIFEEGVSYEETDVVSPDGWILSSYENPSKPGQNIGSWSNILVRTPGTGLHVRIESEGGGYSAECLTGSKGPGACDFAGLAAGTYWVWIDGTNLRVKTYMDGKAYATLVFARLAEDEK